jgi:hypothetical protein
MTISEMMASPFASTLAPKGRKGSYMVLCSLSFSILQMMGHNRGINLANNMAMN